MYQSLAREDIVQTTPSRKKQKMCSKIRTKSSGKIRANHDDDPEDPLAFLFLQQQQRRLLPQVLSFVQRFGSRLCGWQPSGGYAPPVGHLRTTPDTRTELILSSSNPETTFRPSPCSPPPGRPLVRLARASSLPASAAFLRDRALSGAEPTAVHIRTKPTRRSRFSAPTRLLS